MLRQSRRILQPKGFYAFLRISNTESNKMRMTMFVGECLSEEVMEEYHRKAFLGEYVIISRNGKTRRVSVKKVLKITQSE